MIRWIKRLLIAAVALFAAVVVAGLIAAWYFLPLPPLFDDGPFHGSPTASVADRTPDQSFSIYNGMALEVFDPLAENESPIVQLRQSDGSVRWSIFADGFEQGDVDSVRFTESSKGLARSGTVHADVEWTYGHEGSMWFITKEGDLRDYWFSW